MRCKRRQYSLHCIRSGILLLSSELFRTTSYKIIWVYRNYGTSPNERPSTIFFRIPDPSWQDKACRDLFLMVLRIAWRELVLKPLHHHKEVALCLPFFPEREKSQGLLFLSFIYFIFFLQSTYAGFFFPLFCSETSLTPIIHFSIPSKSAAFSSRCKGSTY